MKNQSQALSGDKDENDAQVDVIEEIIALKPKKKFTFSKQSATFVPGASISTPASNTTYIEVMPAIHQNSTFALDSVPVPAQDRSLVYETEPLLNLAALSAALPLQPSQPPVLAALPIRPLSAQPSQPLQRNQPEQIQALQTKPTLDKQRTTQSIRPEFNQKLFDEEFEGEELGKEHLNIVFIGHVDAGKSTMGGHIL